MDRHVIPILLLPRHLFAMTLVVAAEKVSPCLYVRRIPFAALAIVVQMSFWVVWEGSTPTPVSLQDSSTTSLFPSCLE